MLVPNRNKVFIATKFGFRYTEKRNPSTAMLDNSAKWTKEAVELSLKRLDVDHIDLFYLHRIDPKTPIEETVAAMADLVKEENIIPIPGTKKRKYLEQNVGAIDILSKLY